MAKPMTMAVRTSTCGAGSVYCTGFRRNALTRMGSLSMASPPVVKRKGFRGPYASLLTSLPERDRGVVTAMVGVVDHSARAQRWATPVSKAVSTRSVFRWLHDRDERRSSLQRRRQMYRATRFRGADRGSIADIDENSGPS